LALLDDLKKVLRVSSPLMETEIQDLINAAYADLQLAGIDISMPDDPLIKRAVSTYCKAYFGYDNPDADRFIKAYNSLKIGLSLSEDYTESG
jgi:hypothetical protein